MTTTDWTTDAQGTGQYAEVNGINLYFESHGAGRPLILLHGGPWIGRISNPWAINSPTLLDGQQE